MATFYLDFEGGNDANNGTTYALRWKSIPSGATAARIAPGDTIRIMASPDPTSLGVNGTWTGNQFESTVAISSSTNATPIVITTSASHGYSSGDTVYINGHTTNTKANGVWEITVLTANTFSLQNADGTNSVGNGVGGATGTCRRINNARVMLASALTQSIALTGNQGTKTNWTASANVTGTIITTDNKEGAECQQLAIAAGFTTGKAAYFPTGTLDLSGYQQISFWIKQTSGTVGAAGATRLILCSDALGATAVDTFDIPSLGGLNTWNCITINKGSALGASIQSIAFNVVTDNAAQTFLLDNIIAVKSTASADALSLSTLIGKNTTGETWYGIQSINNKRVMLDLGTNARWGTAATYNPGYAGTTETVTTYIRKTIRPTAPAASSTTTIATVQDAGTSAGGQITYSGGWNRTDMSTQTGETWYDGINGFGTFWSGQQSFNSVEKVNIVRMTAPFGTSTYGNMWQVSNCQYNNNSSAISVAQECGCTFDNIIAEMNTTNALVLGSGADRFRISNSRFTSSGGSGVLLSGRDTIFDTCTFNNNLVSGVSLYYGADLLVKNSSTKWNTTSGFGISGLNASGGGSTFYLKDCTINETTEVSNTAGTLASVYAGLKVFSHNHDGVAGTHRIFCSGGQIDTETTVRHTASGVSWAIKPTATQIDVNNPLYFQIAKIAVNASALVTVKGWFRRSNTGLTLGLLCKGGQISGVTSDVSSNMTAAADTWEELTITFTPSVAGVVEIHAIAYGGTTYTGYVDDLTVTQA